MSSLKKYDLIIIGTGSAMNIVDAFLQRNPNTKIAVIDKDEPGGICLTRGCIPSKILLYPAELVRKIEEAKELGVEAPIQKIDFLVIMERMRHLIGKDIESIRQGLSTSENLDYYHNIAEFVSPYTLKIQEQTITAPMIFLCTGSKISIPKIKGLDQVDYLTSDTLLGLSKLPESLIIVGGGYIAAEYGHFFSSMGSQVTIIGRNPQFLPDEEPEISSVARQSLEKHLKIFTGQEVQEVKKSSDSGKITVTASEAGTGKVAQSEADALMIAAGRVPTTDILHPEKAGIRTTKDGWIEVNEYLETSQKNIWALGDADGMFLFKHVANYESEIVYYNALLKRQVRADYHAIPHAVFTYPEIASVGMKEKEAVEMFGREKILIGFYKYENTAKGEAINAKDYFVKAIVYSEDSRILGAHIVGPEASILIHEIITAMYAPGERADLIEQTMHIHPALNEVVQRAFGSLMPVEEYRSMQQETRT